ncbi:unnamed protein product [Miscanthus lutarioriparius]|uniref:Protein kinase domain-containing protein n=1 Tax=Miscanthus lutarioriparius TaxID=422564 RepID=A0A811QB45_9POAL|nr:unnamed protein product [Miscanthus lutarioriparius]
MSPLIPARSTGIRMMLSSPRVSPRLMSPSTTLANSSPQPPTSALEKKRNNLGHGSPHRIKRRKLTSEIWEDFEAIYDGETVAEARKGLVYIIRSFMDLEINLEELTRITDNFSVEKIVGWGGYGEVYKAEYKGKQIAVKLLHTSQGIGDKQFLNEVSNHMKVQHPNIVRLVGYCNLQRKIIIEQNDGELRQEAVNEVLSRIKEGYAEKSDAKEHIERMEMAHIKLEAALETSKKWNVTSAPLLRWRSSDYKKRKKCSKRSGNDDKLRGSTVLRRFERFADGATEFLRLSAVMDGESQATSYQMLSKSKHGSAYLRVEKTSWRATTRKDDKVGKRRKQRQDKKVPVQGWTSAHNEFVSSWIAHMPAQLQGSVVDYWIHKEKRSTPPFLLKTNACVYDCAITMLSSQDHSYLARKLKMSSMLNP